MEGDCNVYALITVDVPIMKWWIAVYFAWLRYKIRDSQTVANQLIIIRWWTKDITKNLPQSI